MNSNGKFLKKKKKTFEKYFGKNYNDGINDCTTKFGLDFDIFNT